MNELKHAIKDFITTINSIIKKPYIKPKKLEDFGISKIEKAIYSIGKENMPNRICKNCRQPFKPFFEALSISNLITGEEGHLCPHCETINEFKE